MTYGIFLSHTAQDLDLVQGIKAQVEAIGVRVYLYEEHSAPGEPLTPHLQRVIREHDALVVLLTPSSAPRSYVQQEIGLPLVVASQRWHWSRLESIQTLWRCSVTASTSSSIREIRSMAWPSYSEISTIDLAESSKKSSLLPWS